MRTLGIAGTAKNTGKTTTMSAVIAQLRKTQPSLRLAVTSIGYDGEYLDNITGLPKPRIQMQAGDLAAVAEECLRYSRAKLAVLERTDIMTPMGPILIGRVETAGKLVVGGPNKRIELRRVLALLASYGAELTLVDGALGRIVPMCEVDELILATGASRHTDIARLASETARITSVLSIARIQPQGAVSEAGPVLSTEDYAKMRTVWASADTLRIRGLMGEAYLALLAGDADVFAGKTLLFENPMSLLLSGEIGKVDDCLARIQSAGVRIGVDRPVRLVAVTINPYYPRYRFTNKYYEPAYVDKDALHLALSQSIPTPVINIVEEGPASLLAHSQLAR